MSEYQGSILEIRDHVEAELQRLLGDDADVRVTPARDWQRLNIWVVSPAATPNLLDQLPAHLGPSRDLYNLVQIFESEEDAAEFGVPPESMSPLERPDWVSRAGMLNVPHDAVAGEPRLGSAAVVTFYSYRGGVGRTTALAHSGSVLAARGRRVLMIDADFEAPGLHHAFGVRVEGQPLLSVLGLLKTSSSVSALDVRDFLTRIPGYSDLYLLSPGEPTPEYVSKLAALDTGGWSLLPRNPAFALLDLLAASEIRPDVIIVDARTGLAESSAPFLLGGTDHAVICFYPSAQSRAGTKFVVDAVTAAPSRRGLPVGLHFIATPLPQSRAASVDPALLEVAKTWAASWASGSSREDDSDDVDFQAIPYNTAIALTDDVVSDPALLNPYVAIADWLDPIEESVSYAEDDLSTIRHELQFNAGNSDDPTESISELFVETKDSRRVDDPRTLLVVGRKGTGKTTLFRRLLTTQLAVAVTAPESLRTEAWWPSSPVWAQIDGLEGGFAVAWPLLIALRVVEDAERRGFLVDDELSATARSVRAGSANGFLTLVRQVSSQPDAEINALTFLSRAAAPLPSPHRVVFDGLDTAFGYTKANRDLRTRALTRLMSLLLDRESSLPTLAFTVFLRTDIEEDLNFVNRSHLFGRTLNLRWERTAYLKTVLKQALQTSPAFARMTDTQPSEVDELSVDRTIDVWRALVGTRVRGKQTTFTDRWVWARLADGNGDHSPRHLSQLFRVLSERARVRTNEPGPPLRARDFGPALEGTVSPEALRAVSDEFDEDLVREVRQVLQRLARTPFTIDEWEHARGTPELLEQASLMGLVATHPRDRDRVEVPRLVVPELYRYALGIRRMGPA